MRQPAAGNGRGLRLKDTITENFETKVGALITPRNRCPPRAGGSTALAAALALHLPPRSVDNLMTASPSEGVNIERIISPLSFDDLTQVVSKRTR